MSEHKIRQAVEEYCRTGHKRLLEVTLCWDGERMTIAEAMTRWIVMNWDPEFSMYDHIVNSRYYIGV